MLDSSPHVQLNPNYTFRRFAVASAIAASSIPALLLARGHRISNIPEVPLVVSSEAFRGLAKTSQASALLTSIGVGPDLTKVKSSRKMRAGKGKMRRHRFRQRRGPLIVYNPKIDGSIDSAFRNLPGVETSSIYALNLLQLAPGSHLGRLVVWTSAAFAALDDLYGSTTTPSKLKKDYLLPSNLVANADLSRLINSSEVQAVVRPKGEARGKRPHTQKKNPLRNRQILLRLNPYAAAFSQRNLGQEKHSDGRTRETNSAFQGVLMTE